MKKIIFTTALIITCFLFADAQSKYEIGMTKAFDLIGERKIDESVAMFERISQAEQDQWLPAFHGAHTLIWSSFAVMEKSEREAMLEKAKLLVATAQERSADNAEIYSLEAMLYTSYMAFDPATYGMMYAGKVEGLHNKAIDLDPSNPRVISGKIRNAHGKASFFGQDTSSYCEEMKKIIPKFKAEKVKEPFAPSFGLREAEGFVQNCNE